MSKIFWDTNLFVYLVEGGAETDRVATLRRRMLKRGDELLTSALTLGELLVKPAEKGNTTLVRRYEQAISRNGFAVRPPRRSPVRGDPAGSLNSGTGRHPTRLRCGGRHGHVRDQRPAPEQEDRRRNPFHPVS